MLSPSFLSSSPPVTLHLPLPASCSRTYLVAPPSLRGTEGGLGSVTRYERRLIRSSFSRVSTGVDPRASSWQGVQVPLMSLQAALDRKSVV